MSLTLLPQAPTIPEGFCLTSIQQLMNMIAQDFNWAITGNVGFHVGDSPPSDITQLWFRTISGYPDDLFMWVPAVGMWLSVYKSFSNDSRWVVMWDGIESDLWSVDGGDGVDPSAVAPTLTTGSFWEVVDSLAGRFPLGPGNLSTSGTAVGQGDSGVSDQVTLNTPQLPPHRHNIGIEGTGNVTDGAAGTLRTAMTNIDWQAGTIANSLGQTRDEGDANPVTVQPPYYGIYFVRRTIRKYRTAA